MRDTYTYKKGTYILTLILLLCSFVTFGQEEKKKKNIFKSIYEQIFKYGTIYVAGDINNAQVEQESFFVRPPEGGSLYDVPEVIDVSTKHPFDYRYGFGIRKLGRFGYERKPDNFWTGNVKREKQNALSAPTSAVDGLEYLLHYEKERHRGEVWSNSRYFVRHTGDYHIVKLEQRNIGSRNFEYKSAELRARLPIGKKFSLSAGAIYRTHQRGYGFNPIELWLNQMETDEFGNQTPTNYWWTLGYQYGYEDVYYSSVVYNNDGTTQQMGDWLWRDDQGNVVAYTDLQFRNTVFRELMNRYNRDFWQTVEPYHVVSPIVGFDFYHYKSNFWIHAYASVLLPYHKYIFDDREWDELNYGYRNGWKYDPVTGDENEFEQWTDYQGGLNMGWKISKTLGVFVEGEYTKMWDTEFFNSTFGINYTFR